MSKRQMRRGTFPARTLKIAIPTVAALGAGAAIATGAIPASDGTIDACYSNPGSDTGFRPGTLRVIDPSGTGEAASCDSDETPISWNQKGPKGDPGQPGQNGQNGQNGQPGSPGAQGPAGQSVVTANSKLAPPLEMDLFLKDGKKLVSGIDAFSTGVSSNGPPVGSAGVGRRTVFRSFQIVKPADQASTTLFNDAATGAVISKIVVTQHQIGQGQHITSPFVRYTLRNAIVSNYQHGVPPSEESIAFEFEKIEVDYADSKGQHHTVEQNKAVKFDLTTTHKG